jgi:hypothetical protein
MAAPKRASHFWYGRFVSSPVKTLSSFHKTPKTQRPILSPSPGEAERSLRVACAALRMGRGLAPEDGKQSLPLAVDDGRRAPPKGK